MTTIELHVQIHSLGNCHSRRRQHVFLAAGRSLAMRRALFVGPTPRRVPFRTRPGQRGLGAQGLERVVGFLALGGGSQAGFAKQRDGDGLHARGAGADDDGVLLQAVEGGGHSAAAGFGEDWCLLLGNLRGPYYQFGLAVWMQKVSKRYIHSYCITEANM